MNRFRRVSIFVYHVYQIEAQTFFIPDHSQKSLLPVSLLRACLSSIMEV